MDRDVIEWLKSEAGISWTVRNFRRPFGGHEWVEFAHDDCPVTCLHLRHIQEGDVDRTFRAFQEKTFWEDLVWTPDQPPERV